MGQIGVMGIHRDAAANIILKDISYFKKEHDYIS